MMLVVVVVVVDFGTAEAAEAAAATIAADRRILPFAGAHEEVGIEAEGRGTEEAREARLRVFLIHQAT